MDRTLKLCALAIGLGLCGGTAMAQETEEDINVFGPEAGDWEFTLTGGGSNNNDFDAGGFSLGGSLGYFFTDAAEVVLRQNVTFADFGDSSWAGSTRIALDYHFDLDRLRPFIGANIGGVYGEDVSETFAAGLEAGLKYYVKEETFIFAMGEYQWFFDDGDDADDSFDDGQFVYSVGIGFNF